MSGSFWAGVGALATFGTLILGVLQYRRNRQTRHPHAVAFIRKEPYKNAAYLLSFEVVNRGERPIHISKRGIVLPEGEKLGFYPVNTGFPEPTLPAELPPDQRIWVVEWPTFVAADLRRWGYSGTATIRAYFEDETRHEFRSAKYEIDVDKLADQNIPRRMEKHDAEVARLRQKNSRKPRRLGSMTRSNQATLMAYELWNGESGTLLLERSTKEEALDVVRAAIDRHGPSYANNLALIFEDGQGDSEVIAEGVALARLIQTPKQHAVKRVRVRGHRPAKISV